MKAVARPRARQPHVPSPLHAGQRVLRADRRRIKIGCSYTKCWICFSGAGNTRGFSVTTSGVVNGSRCRRLNR